MECTYRKLKQPEKFQLPKPLNRLNPKPYSLSKVLLPLPPKLMRAAPEGILGLWEGILGLGAAG